MPTDHILSQRFEMRATDSWIHDVDDWRRKQPDIPSRAEAIAGWSVRLRYPVLIDSKNQVLSMPPIINSEETKVKQGTTRVFIDVTRREDV